MCVLYACRVLIYVSIHFAGNFIVPSRITLCVRSLPRSSLINPPTSDEMRTVIHIYGLPAASGGLRVNHLRYSLIAGAQWYRAVVVIVVPR